MTDDAKLDIKQYQQWAVLSRQETEPHRIFYTREQADRITTWRNEHDIPSRTVHRWVSEWQQTDP